LKQVLDNRFFAEYYYSQDRDLYKKAYKKMEELIHTSDGIVPTIVLSEIVQLVCSREGKERAEMIYLSIMQSGLKIESLTPSIAKEVGLIKSSHGNVPIGDCIIAATAIKNQARVVSDDPHFDFIPQAKRVWL
jgi:Predicted nucleic acid-binding protein, contains PIN domain